MNDKYEFDFINIYLGVCVPLLIFNCILGILSQMHIGIGVICAIVMGILYVKTFMIMYNEMKIWANVVLLE